MRIGGELELELSHLAPSPDPSLQAWRHRLPGSTTLASTGRAALLLILEAIRRADPSARTFLLPSYLCGSLLDPFARAGLDIRFVPLAEGLRLPVEDLERLVTTSGAAGLLFINYFGHPVSEPERNAVADLKKKFWVIEDCVPGGLVEQRGRGIGDVGHFAFTSFRKYTPLPDGALVWNRSELSIEAPVAVDACAWVRLRALGKVLRDEFLRQGSESLFAIEPIERAFLELFAASENLLDASGGERGPSHLSANLGGFDLEEAAMQRRENGRRLHARFEGERPEWAEPLLPAPGERDAPSFLPLRCRDRAYRDGLQGHLGRDGIFCAIHWNLPSSVPEDACAWSHDLASRILCLPLDHRCGMEEMDRMHARVLAFRPH